MFEENYSSNQNQLTKQDSVKSKIAHIKQTQKLIKQIEKLEIEIAKLSRQIDSKEQKLNVLLEELDSS